MCSTPRCGLEMLIWMVLWPPQIILQPKYRDVGHIHSYGAVKSWRLGPLPFSCPRRVHPRERKHAWRRVRPFDSPSGVDIKLVSRNKIQHRALCDGREKQSGCKLAAVACLCPQGLVQVHVRDVGCQPGGNGGQECCSCLSENVSVFFEPIDKLSACSVRLA